MTKEFLSKLGQFWKKFWFIVWKDDSLKGWIISIIFLFIVIKFVFFPLLSLVTGTSLPLAIVESCSMYHEGNLFSDFDQWWQKHEAKYKSFTINQLDFQDYKFKNGFNKGDILFIVGVKPEKIKKGDVIIFEAGNANPLIHRIVDIKINPETGDYTFSTMGDNNNGQLSFEKTIKPNQIVGKATFKLAPYLGWVNLSFLNPKNHLMKEVSVMKTKHLKKN